METATQYRPIMLSLDVEPRQERFSELEVVRLLVEVAARLDGQTPIEGGRGGETAKAASAPRAGPPQSERPPSG